MGFLDNRMFVDHFPPKRRRERIHKAYYALGGSAAVGAETVVRLGGRASFWGRRGNDVRGEQIANFLRKAGVDVSGYRPFAGTSPYCEVFIRPDGERYLFPWWGEGMPEHTGWVTHDALDRAGAVLIDGRWEDGGLHFAKQARRLGIPVILDLDLDNTAVWQIARLATHAIADEDMAIAHGGVNQLLKEISDRGVWGAITLGYKGVVHAGGRVKAPQVPVLDSTGAGDVFHGAFALAIAQHREETDALQFATVAGALRCKLARVPKLAEVRELLK